MLFGCKIISIKSWTIKWKNLEQATRFFAIVRKRSCKEERLLCMSSKFISMPQKVKHIGCLKSTGEKVMKNIRVHFSIMITLISLRWCLFTTVEPWTCLLTSSKSPINRKHSCSPSVLALVKPSSSKCLRRPSRVLSSSHKMLSAIDWKFLRLVKRRPPVAESRICYWFQAIKIKKPSSWNCLSW